MTSRLCDLLAVAFALGGRFLSSLALFIAFLSRAYALSVVIVLSFNASALLFLFYTSRCLPCGVEVSLHGHVSFVWPTRVC